MCLPIPKLTRRRVRAGIYRGFEYEVVINHFGALCGYVRVERDHPWFEQTDPDCDVHGGITFAEHGTACATHGPEAEWWIGFDTAHGFDLPDPKMEGHPMVNPRDNVFVGNRLLADKGLDLPWRNQVWTLRRVLAETLNLVRQADQAAGVQR